MQTTPRATPPEASRGPSSAVTAGPPLERVKILVVDDREDNLVAVESVLRDPAYELVLARSGAEVLRFLLHSECAAILLDVQMPEMDGFETARLVRGNPRTRAIPIVFMTAISREERFIAKGYEAGAIDYIVKPVDPDVLRAKVAAFVELYRARQEIVRQAALLRDKERAERQRAVELLELRNLRRQQAASERYRRLMADITHAIVWTLDRETLACTFASPSAERILGHPHAVWTSAPGIWRDRLPDAERAAFLAALRSVQPGGRSVRVEHGFQRADGRIARFETELRAFAPDEEGEREVRAFSVDVTEARLAEEALAFLARAGSDLTASLDLEATIAEVARAAVPFLADACRVELVVPEGATPPLAAAGAEPEGAPEASLALTLPLRLRDRELGTLRLLRAAGRPFAPRERGVAEEFAARASQAVENALLYREAREAVRVREEFISIASHELRTPLTPLALHWRAVQRTVSAELQPGEVRDGLLERAATCGRQVERMTRLISNLLDVTRVKAFGVEVQPERFDLRDLVGETTARFQDELARSGCTLHVEAPEALFGTWDRARLDQVVTNLVSNAIRHGGNGPVRVAAERCARGVLVSVADRGPGIPPDELSRIFDRFERGRGGSTHGGLGLGLYIVRRIVEAHGGEIGVASEVGAGTTFTVTLPLEAPRPSA